MSVISKKLYSLESHINFVTLNRICYSMSCVSAEIIKMYSFGHKRIVRQDWTGLYLHEELRFFELSKEYCSFKSNVSYTPRICTLFELFVKYFFSNR